MKTSQEYADMALDALQGKQGALAGADSTDVARAQVLATLAVAAAMPLRSVADA